MPEMSSSRSASADIRIRGRQVWKARSTTGPGNCQCPPPPPPRPDVSNSMLSTVARHEMWRCRVGYVTGEQLPARRNGDFDRATYLFGIPPSIGPY